MTFSRTGALALLVPMLAACGDNPDNVPQRGNWTMTTRLGGLTIGGINVPADQIPPELKALEKVEERCGEPMFIDRDWQEKDINRHVKGHCRLSRYDITPTQIIGEGQCTGVAEAADYNPYFRLRVDQSPSRYTIALALEGPATLPGVEGRHTILAAVTQEGVRTGDC